MKLRLPQALLTALLACHSLNTADAASVYSGIDLSTLTGTASGTACGYSYTVNNGFVTFTGLTNLGNSKTDLRPSSLMFDLDFSAVTSRSSANIEQILYVYKPSATSTTWGMGVKGTTAGNNIALAGMWNGNEWTEGGTVDFTAFSGDAAEPYMKTVTDGETTKQLLTMTANIQGNGSATSGMGTGLGLGYTTPTSSSNIYWKVKLKTASEPDNVVLNSKYVDTVYAENYHDGADSLRLINASMTWVGDYNTSTTYVVNSDTNVMPGAAKNDTLVLGGTLTVGGGSDATLLTNSTGAIVVASAGQLSVGKSISNNIILAASDHGQAATQGALYIDNTAGPVTLSGDITLIEDSSIGAAVEANSASDSNKVTISGAVSGAYTLKVLGSQNKNIGFTGGMNVGSLDLGEYDVVVTVSGQDATLGSLTSTGTGNTTLKVNDAAVTVNGNADRIGILDVVDEDASISITGNYTSNKTGVGFSTKGAGSVSIGGNFTTSSTYTLDISANTTVGGTFSSNSMVNIQNGAHLNLTSTGNQTFTKGIDVAAGSRLSTGGNLLIGSSSDSNGSLTNAGTVELGGNLQVFVTNSENGRVVNTGTMGAAGLVSWGHIVNGVADGDNSGTSMTLTRDYATSATYANATLTNYATMSLRIISNHAIITNAGTMTATGGLTNAGTFDNSGTLNISGGNVDISKTIQNTGTMSITLTGNQSLQNPASLANLEQQSLTGLFHDTTGQVATSGYADAYYYLVHSTDGGTLSYTAATANANVSTDANGNLLYRHDTSTYEVNHNMTYGASGTNNDVYNVTAGQNIQVNDGATLTLTEGVKANIGLSTSGTGAVALNGSISSLGTSVAGIGNLKVAAGDSASMNSSLLQQTSGISLESTGSLTVTLNGNQNALNLNLSKVSGSGNLTITANSDSREFNIGDADNFTGTLTINDNSHWIAITGTSSERADGDYYDLVTVKNSGSTKGIAFGTNDMVWHVGNLSGSADISGQYGGSSTRTLVVHQTEDGEYSGTFLADGNTVGRSVSLQKYGDANLRLTAANAALASLDIYEGTITFKDNGTWAGDVSVSSGATLAYNGTGKTLAAGNNYSFDSGATLAVSGGDLTITADKALSIISIAENAALTVGAGTTSTFDHSIYNNGTLTVNGTLSISNANLLSTAEGYTVSYSEGANGYLLGGKVQVFDAVGAVEFGENGKIVVGDTEYTSTDGGQILIDLPSTSKDYYVNSGTVVYGGTGSEANAADSAETTKIILLGGTFDMAKGLNTLPDSTSKVPLSAEGSTVTINLRGIENNRRGVELAKSEVEIASGASITLTGAGTWIIGRDDALGATLGATWTGTVVWEGTGDTYKANNDISAFNQAGSWTEVSKLHGHIAADTGSLGAGSLWLVGDDAMKIGDAYGSSVYTIESLGGSGSILRTSAHNTANFQICITKDSSDWTGKLKSEGGVATMIVRSDEDIAVGGYFEGNAVTLQLEGSGTKTFNNSTQASTVGTLNTNAGILKLDGTNMTVNSTFDMRGGSNKTGDISLVNGAHLTSAVAAGMWGRNDDGHQSRISVDSASTFTENNFDIKGVTAGTSANIYLKDGQYHVNAAVSISDAAIEFKGTAATTMSSVLTDSSLTHTGTGKLTISGTGSTLDILTIHDNEVELTQSATANRLVGGNTESASTIAPRLTLTGETTVMKVGDIWFAERIFNNLSGTGTLEYTGTNTVQVGVNHELRTINGNLHITQATLEFNDWNKGPGGSGAKSPDMAIGGKVTADANVEVVSQAELTINESGTLDAGGQLSLGHTTDSDRNWGKLNVSGTLASDGGIEFRGTKSQLNVAAGSTVTVGKTGAYSELTAKNGSNVNRGTINLADAAKISITDSAISNVDFVTAAEGRSTIEITAGAERSVTHGQVLSCVEAGATGAAPTSTTALMKDCSLKNTDVVISAVGATEAFAAANNHLLGTPYTLDIMSGVKLAAGDSFSLELKGLENYTNVKLYWSSTGLTAGTGLDGSTDLAGTVNLDNNSIGSMAYNGGQVLFENGVSGHVVNVWATYNIPEPTTGVLSVLALAGLAARRRRRASGTGE